MLGRLMMADQRHLDLSADPALHTIPPYLDDKGVAAANGCLQAAEPAVT
jgi:hypothetical protein